MWWPVGARIPDGQREAILADVRAGGLSCRAIAKKHGVSAATVSGLAREHGLTFERSDGKTRAATAARAFDAKTARAQMIERLHGDAERFRERAWQPCTTLIGTGPQAMWVTTNLPSFRDQQSAYTSLGIALDKALTLERHDDDSGQAAGQNMLGDLMAALGAVHERIVAEDDTAADAGRLPGARE
jgi:transposase-like protein